jgi:hypothetical protein
MPDIPLGVLDLVPIPSGSTAADALRNSIDLAQHAERFGYARYWFAEHHLNPGVAGTSHGQPLPQMLLGQGVPDDVARRTDGMPGQAGADQGLPSCRPPPGEGSVFIRVRRCSLAGTEPV